MVKATNFKNWCTENITPQSWPRIILKAIPELREKGVDTAGLQEPDDSIMLSEDIIEILNKWLTELYDVQVKEEVLT